MYQYQAYFIGLILNLFNKLNNILIISVIQLITL